MAGAASQAGDADLPRHWVSPLVCRGPLMSTVVLYCWCNSDSASVLLYFFYIVLACNLVVQRCTILLIYSFDMIDNIFAFDYQIFISLEN